jgi:hypothetical protein
LLPAVYGHDASGQQSSSSVATATDCCRHTNNDHEHARKRRRVDREVTMPRSGLTSPRLHEQAGIDIEVQRKRDLGTGSLATHYGASGTEIAPSTVMQNSPLARKMADLSLLLCPCCGFSNWGHHDG